MRNTAYPILISTMLLSACSLAPDFKLPEIDTPQTFKREVPEAVQAEIARGNWVEAQDLQAVEKGNWWHVFGDPALNVLMDEAVKNNHSLLAASSRVEQSRAIAESNTFSFLPDIGISANAVRRKPSDGSLVAFGAGGQTIKPFNLYSASGVLSWEADLFGRVRDGYKAFLMDAESLKADYQNMLLTLQADVASNYYAIRALDTEIDLLNETVKIRDKAYNIIKRKNDVGAAGVQDLTRSMSERASTRAELTSLKRERAVLEHALAVLLGKAPAQFTLPSTPLVSMPPKVPAGIPSTLLQRRPDIAQAQYAMAAANARIGVARTAFFPIINLTAGGGYESTLLPDLFNWGSRTWALGQGAGAAITMPLFEAGRNFARLDSAKLAYVKSVENYKQNVLVAFQDVEDNLVNQRLLAVQSEQQNEAASAAARTTKVVRTRYDEGAVDFFEVVNAQRESLAAARLAVKVRGQRFLTTIALIRSLGGGWNIPLAFDYPTPIPEDAIIRQPSQEVLATTSKSATKEDVKDMPTDKKSTRKATDKTSKK